ncbi:MAG: LytTR family transcriptional regulator [Cytophagales bacterium]|nr:LytTR family transcriptional regulator [Cytophagales bacterium]
MEYYNIKRNDFVRLNSVIYLEAQENYTLFHLKDGSSVISSTTLKRHEERLSLNVFLRVNRSTLVNSAFVKKVTKKDQTNFVKLKNGLEIKVSRRRRDTLDLIAS